VSGVRDNCDLYQHAWFPVDADWKPPFQGSIKTMRCERCGSEKREIWQPNTGRLIYRRYVHTEGWVVYSKGERPTKDDLRLAEITKEIIAAREARKKKLVS
jgi:hypothetical protein